MESASSGIDRAAEDHVDFGDLVLLVELVHDLGTTVTRGRRRRWRGRRWRRADDLGRGLGGCRGRLNKADVVGGDAVEAVGVADLAGVGRRGGCRVRLPERVGAAVVGDVDVVAGDAGAGAVGAGPGDGEARAWSWSPGVR